MSNGSDQPCSPDDFPPGSPEAEAHLARLLHLGFPHVARDYASKKNLADVLKRLEAPSVDDAGDSARRESPQYLNLCAGLLLMWLSATMLFKHAILIIADTTVVYALLGRLLASVAFCLVAAVLLGAMTKRTLDTFRVVLRVGIPAVFVGGLIAAIVL